MKQGLEQAPQRDPRGAPRASMARAGRGGAWRRRGRGRAGMERELEQDPHRDPGGVPCAAPSPLAARSPDPGTAEPPARGGRSEPEPEAPPRRRLGKAQLGVGATTCAGAGGAGAVAPPERGVEAHGGAEVGERERAQRWRERGARAPSSPRAAR